MVYNNFYISLYASSRYMFNDPDDLPAWFKEDEDKHMTATLPVTRVCLLIKDDCLQKI